MAGMGGSAAPVVASAASTPAWTAYIGGMSSTVTPMDTATGALGTPIAVGSQPASIGITPNGKIAYVVLSNTDSVMPINAVTNIPGAPIHVGSYPLYLAIAPDGKMAYVTNEMSNTVTPINIGTNTAEPPINVGAYPFGIAITPNGRTAYVANLGADSVSPIDLATGIAGPAIPVGSEPYDLAITPDGATVLVADTHSNSVTPINVATNIAGAAIPVGNHPYSIAITPDGATAYVSNSADSSVTPIHIATDTAGSAISVAAGVGGIASAPDGKTVYVTGFGSTVTPIDTTTNTPETPIVVGSQSGGIAITPDQAPVASLTATGSALGMPTTFDASASTVAYGGIASYAWNFGDGSTATTTTPTTTHTYAAAGADTVTVTETSTAGTSTSAVFTGQTMSQNGGPSAHASRVVTIVAPGVYSALTPFRVCDTRAALPANQCTGHTLGAVSSIDVQVTGKTGPLGQSVPGNAQSVALNVTAVSHGSVNSYLSVFPSGEALPNVSNISFDAGAAQANLVVVRLAGGGVTVFNAAGRADVVVDVEGYFAPPGASPVAGEFHAMPALRICDTRAGTGTGCAGAVDEAVPGNTWRDVVLSGLPSGVAPSTPSVPTHGAASAVFNLTAVGGTQSTYVTVRPPDSGTDACPTGAPATSNVNPRVGTALPNRVISALGPHQDVCIYNAVGSIDVIVDVNGWFGDGSEAPTVPPGAFFYSVPPARICDTRSAATGSGTECENHKLGPKSMLVVQVAGQGLIPNAGGSNPPVAVVANLTGVAGTAATVFTLVPDGGHRPVASDLNPRAGDVVANLAFVEIATSGPEPGAVDLYNDVGTINAILDIAGWFQ
jgi:YVTN family beta-propeller protein